MTRYRWVNLGALRGARRSQAMCGRLFLLLAVAGCSLPPTPGARTGAFVPPDSTVAVLDGVVVVDGGLSALDVDAGGALWAVADRGPNLDADSLVGRPAKRFALPDYTPSLVRLLPRADRLAVTARRPVRVPGGRAATGRPVPSSGRASVETAVGPDGEILAPDPWGVDAEGIAFDGTDLWLAEEYRPSLWRLDAETFAVRERWTPEPDGPLDRALPPVVEGRQPNLGFEGVAVLDGRVWASLQGPIRTAETDPATPLVRIVALDPETGTAETFAYPMDRAGRKLGDLAALPDGRLLVIEHGPGADGVWAGEVYAVSVRGATPLARGALPEAHPTADAARANGHAVLDKRLMLDLVPAGWPAGLHKPEGLAVLPGGRLAVLADNDYGVDAPAVDGRPVATNARTTLVVFPVPELRQRER